MDGYEATRIVFSRIQNLDPENASKIMGLLLLQDHGEKEMIRLAFGPETLIHSLILKAKVELGISLPSNSPINSPSTPPSPSPFLPTNQKISTSTPTITIPRHNSSSTPWNSNFSADFPNPDEFISPNNNSTMNSSALPFYGSSNNNSSNGGGISDIIDEFQLQDQLSFLNDNVDSNNMILPSYWGGGGVHRRSCSVSEVMGCGGGGDNDLNSGFGWRPCLYFARGYCKNGSSCRFIHGGGIGDQPDGPATMVGSPSKIETTMDQCHELLRSKSAAAQHQQQQRLAAAAASFPFSPKGMNLFLQQQQNEPQRAAAAALMMNEDIHKFSRSRLERNDFSTMVNPASRQIYLTFPADSTFREEDVSNYFSIYGPVQDVRIPYQQKRMFGFVTFVYPETVKMILAKGNPHFVCDARVLVKPYKEKGKVPDKFRKQQQQMERGEYSSPCGTPTGLDSRDPFDLQLGARMLYNSTQDMLWRRKMEEQADLQQAIELQSRRLMNLQLLDVKNKHHQRALSTGSPIPSPTNHSPNLFHQNLVLPPFHTNTSDIPHAEKCSSPLPNISLAGGSLEKQSATDGGAGVVGDEENGNGNGKKSFHIEDGDLLGSLEHNLPDSPFASPTKGCGEYMTAFSKGASSSSSSSTENNNLVAPANLVPASSSLDMASFKSFNCQIPRFSSGHGGAIGMYSGSGGPTCPVGI